MWRRYYVEKWTDEMISKVMEILKDVIINAYPLIEILKKSGGCVSCYGFKDSFTDPMVERDWVGGIVAVSRVFDICPPGQPDLVMNIELNMSTFLPYYAVIRECQSGNAEYYGDYDEFLDGLLNIDFL